MNAWPYNTARWQRLRRLQLTNEPCCRYCALHGRTTPAIVVDHIVPVRDDRSLVFDQSNLQSLCESCHNGAKQSEERTGERVGCDVDGVPLKGWA